MFGQSLLSAFGSAACTTDTDQLFPGTVQDTTVATYQFNNATTSIPSNTYPGTPSNITYATGKFGNAAVFNGTSSRINLSNNPINGLSSVSFSFWIKPLDISSYQYVLSFINAVGGWNGLGVRISNTGKIQVVRANSGAVTSSENSTTSLSLNVWQHIVVTVQQSGTVIYINGSEDGTFSNTPFTTNNTGSFDIGMNEYNPGVTQAWTNGSIDQLRIFNSVLPQAAVTALYNETTTTATYPYVDYVGANPNSIAYYKMSDATDQFGNYNGTASNVNFNTVGKFGFAGAFNGSSSYIDTSGLLSLFGSKNTNTVSLWFKTTTTNYSTLFSDYASTSLNNSIDLNGSGNIEVFTRYSNTTSTISTTSGNYNDGNWHNVVHVVDTSGLTSTLYIDGSQIGSSVSISSNSWNGAATQKVTIGALYYTVGSFYQAFFNGSIDQIRIYDSALSAANVTKLYKEIECPEVDFLADYLVIAGGGGGGVGNPSNDCGGGGGGAGGYISSSSPSGGGCNGLGAFKITPGLSYAITVGSGGNGGYGSGQAGSNGSNSILFGNTAIGGGGGSTRDSQAGSGGSAGAGSCTGLNGSSTSCQGYGISSSGGTSAGATYGGGGAGSQGARGVNGGGGTGGNGVASSITGSSITRAGGGGGGKGNGPATGGPGGSGGGGAGGIGHANSGTNGSVNTGSGGGGGGGFANASTNGGNGGSGVAIISYPTSKVSSFAVTGTLNTPTPIIVGTDSVLNFTTGTGTVTFS